jgi:hypothetical protein
MGAISRRDGRSNKLGAIDRDIQAADVNGYAGDTTAYAGAEGEVRRERDSAASGGERTTNLGDLEKEV